MSTNPLTMTPSGAAGAYARVQSGSSVDSAVGGIDAGSSASDGSGFGSTLQRALEGVVQTSHEADAKAMEGISGEGNITDVVMAVSRAQLALQSTVAIRDKVVQSYQDVMKMSI
jgi:flagellar hook-basal body complex protein FliE